MASGSGVPNENKSEQMLTDNTYKRLFGTFFCEKPVMLKVKIEKVKREMKWSPKSIYILEDNIGKEKGSFLSKKKIIIKFCPTKHQPLTQKKDFLEEMKPELTCWISVSTILYWSGM